MVVVTGVDVESRSSAAGASPIGVESEEHQPTVEESPGSAGTPKRMHVLIVMDGTKEFSMEPVEWVLKNVDFAASWSVTLLGIMPWLNMPLSSKTWSDIWSMDLEDLSNIKEKYDWKNDVKYQRVQLLIDLCQRYGVVPQIKTEMGHPLRLIVLEQITSLHATMVVFDKHHDRKKIEYYAEKVPCSMVLMNDDGEVEEMFKGRCCLSQAETTPSETPYSRLISEQLRKILMPRCIERHVGDGNASPDTRQMRERET